jgi:diguanylate cyclase (GGDEF)-like protein
VNARNIVGNIAALSSSGIERMLYVFCVFVVPLLAVAMTIYAVIDIHGEVSLRKGSPVPVTFIEDTTGALKETEAAKILESTQSVAFLDTKRSESPFWFRFTLPRLPQGSPAEVIELPSRHATDWTCWQQDAPNGSFKILGEASRRISSGSVIDGITGFAMNTEALAPGTPLVCRARFVGPARLSMVSWSAATFADAVHAFDWQSGLLDGGLLLFATFVVFMALINRDWMYLLFAAWLVCNWRFAAISAGLDIQWLSFSVPPEWLSLMRKITAAGFDVTTVALFSKIFEIELKQVGHRDLLRVAQWSCLPLTLAAIFLPFALWLPVLWALTALTIAMLVFLLVLILRQTRSRVAIFYALSLAVILLSSFNEILGAALGMKALIGVLNSVTASLSSSLLVSFAIGQHMRDTRMALARAEKRLRDTFETIPIGIFTLHRASGEIVQANASLQELSGNGGIGRTWQESFGETEWQKFSQSIENTGLCEMEMRLARHDDAQEHYFQIEAVASGDFIEGSLADVTEKTLATNRLKFLVSHDPLTGFTNRQGLEIEYERLNEAGYMSMAFMDVDKFTLINDMYGFAAGDEALVQLAGCINEVLDDDRIHVSRVGADEFVILFSLTDLRHAKRLCLELIDRVEQAPFRLGKSSYSVEISIGLVAIAHNLPLSEAISVAERACDNSKEEGQDGLKVYERDSPLFIDRAQELAMLQRFGANSPPPGLFQVMQPILSLRAPFETLNFEFLLRMHEGDKILPPHQIISPAEKNGRIAIIDRWVLQKTLEWLDTNFARLTTTRFATMNLSGGSLSDERFVADAAAMLAEHPNAASLLCIEITESVGLRDVGKTRRFVDKIKSMGCKFALDDFGAGYTSFSYLKDLEADALKVDGQFVQSIAQHPANQAITATIVDLARNLGMQSIAEWAEDLTTLRLLQEIGADHVQGYVIARPQFADKLLAAKSAADFIQDPLVTEFLRMPRDSLPSLMVDVDYKLRNLH